MVIKKSQDARYQLHVWGKLLEGRIALQKVVLASRDLEKATTEKDTQPARDENSIKSITKLLTCLVRLRDTYRSKSQFKLGESDSQPEDPESYSKIDDQTLKSRHDDYTGVRNDIIDKWYEKTKVGTIPKKGYTALELPTLQLINNALKDKDRLIRRTQIDRTSHQDNAINPETFNDDDFYHYMLKEVISKEETRKWAELQRRKYKSKRKAETKATKGRKIRKDIIPKLVNFMAPSANGPEAIRDELLKSLFGGPNNS